MSEEKKPGSDFVPTKESLTIAIEKNKQEGGVRYTIEWYLANKKALGFKNAQSMLDWYYKKG